MLNSLFKIRYLRKAAKLLKNKRLDDFIFENESKIDEKLSTVSLGKTKSDFLLFLSLIKEYGTGEYREISKKSLLLILGSVLYFMNPMDLVPDFILGAGYLDDISVIAYVVTKLKTELENYRTWKNKKLDKSN